MVVFVTMPEAKILVAAFAGHLEQHQANRNETPGIAQVGVHLAETKSVRNDTQLNMRGIVNVIFNTKSGSSSRNGSSPENKRLEAHGRNVFFARKITKMLGAISGIRTTGHIRDKMH